MAPWGTAQADYDAIPLISSVVQFVAAAPSIVHRPPVEDKHFGFSADLTFQIKRSLLKPIVIHLRLTWTPSARLIAVNTLPSGISLEE